MSARLRTAELQRVALPAEGSERHLSDVTRLGRLVHAHVEHAPAWRHADVPGRGAEIPEDRRLSVIAAAGPVLGRYVVAVGKGERPLGRPAIASLPRAEERAARIIAEARALVDQARAELAEEIRAADRAGMRQVDIVAATGYSRERIRQIIRAGEP